MGEFFDRSYGSCQYVVLAVTPSGAVLRPVDDRLPAYWQEFIRATTGGAVPPDASLTVHLAQLPPEVTSVPAYVDYTIEFPRVEIRVNDKVIDVSDKVACNHPNPETPGLYVLDFTLSVAGEPASPIWRTWLSIDEPPVLRHIVTRWNRTSRVVADLNRLVLEPQFCEALYEAGVPLYNFQQANVPAAVSQYSITGYRDARAFVKGGNLYITGQRLPVGTEVTVSGQHYVLGVTVMVSPFRQTSRYFQGDVVSYGGYNYYALVDIPMCESAGDSTRSSVIPGTVHEEDGESVTCWLRGTLYTVDSLSLSEGEHHVDALRSVVDVGGYLFKMDLLRAFTVQHYWGLYDSKYFYDYAPGDLVSVITDGVLSIYQRNDTPIDETGLEESYRPGHYRNPHWVEVYSASGNSVLRDPVIAPYTNAANAVVCKTCPVREEAFRIYAKMVGMPVELVNAIGLKYSVLLWAVLYRTRETFPGFRAALRAIGLDAPDLHRQYPSVVYTVDGAEVEDIYTEIDAVKKIAKSVAADKIWYGSGAPDLSEKDPRNTVAAVEGVPWIRYSTEADGPENADSVWVYDVAQAQWNKFYTFRHVGSDRSPSTWDFNVNNRYYRATLNLLDRLAKDCVVDVGDNKQWIDHNFIGSISGALVELLSYEIPIYIYLRLRLRLAAIGHASVMGVSGGVVLHDAWGGSVGLKLFPSKYFDFVSMTVMEAYPTVFYAYELPSDDDGWIEYADYAQQPRSRYFAFDRAVYLRFRFTPLPNGVEFKEVAFNPATSYVPPSARNGKWVSQYTIGCLGNAESPGTGDYVPSSEPPGYDGFMDATCMPSGSDLYLCKGFCGVTMRVATSSLEVTAECLQWRYIFHDSAYSDGNWGLGSPEDDPEPFADWADVDVKPYIYWSGDVTAFKAALTKITSYDGELRMEWDEDSPYTLCIYGKAQRAIYLWNADNYVIGMLQFGYVANMVVDTDAASCWARVTFAD